MPQDDIYSDTPHPELAAQTPALAPLASDNASGPQVFEAASSDASVASPPTVAALANELAYTLTVGQARELFAKHGRKVPAERTIQHYCIEKNIEAQKIRTTFGSEWLINETSLIEYISRQPIVTTASIAPQAPQQEATLSKPAAASSANSDADGASGAMPAVLIGERRTLAEMLIENAKLLATIEGKELLLRGKDETIAELKDDRSFLRDEVREARQQRQDVKEIASRMLEAMQTIAIAGKLPPASSRNDDVTAHVFNADQNSQSDR
jgi:hypothetical protein